MTGKKRLFTLARSHLSLFLKPAVGVPLFAPLLVGGLLVKEARERGIRVEEVLQQRSKKLMALKEVNFLIPLSLLTCALFPRGGRARPFFLPRVVHLTPAQFWTLSSIEMVFLRERVEGVNDRLTLESEAIDLNVLEVSTDINALKKGFQGKLQANKEAFHKKLQANQEVFLKKLQADQEGIKAVRSLLDNLVENRLRR